MRLEVRASRDEIVEVREETAWPLRGARYDRFYLDPELEALGPLVPAVPSEATYDARRGSRVFRHAFDTDTEITTFDTAPSIYGDPASKLANEKGGGACASTPVPYLTGWALLALALIAGSRRER